MSELNINHDVNWIKEPKQLTIKYYDNMWANNKVKYKIWVHSCKKCIFSVVKYKMIMVEFDKNNKNNANDN